MRVKILFTQDALVNAGAERSHLEILSRFSKAVDLGLVYYYPKHELREAYERAGIRLFFLDIPEGYHFTLAVGRLVSLIRKEKPDLLVSSLWRADIITRIASFITGVPLVGTLVNDSYAPIAWTDKKGLKYKVVYWLDRLTAGIPIHWIANAQALADSHVKTLGIERSKISVVYRGRPVLAGNVIGSAAKQSFKAKNSTNETASAAESFDIKSEISNSSLEVTAVTDDVIGSDAGAKQSFTDKKTASAADASEDNSDFPNSSLAVTSPEETASSDSVGIAVTQPEKNASPRSVSSPTETTIKNFISYGRLLERKGFQDAIRAFSKVFQTFPDCTLTIFGEGPYRNPLKTLIQDLNLQKSVFLPGKISNPMDVLINGYYLQTSSTCQVLTTGFDSAQPDNCQLQTADCFLFPSWYEGFSGALVEAMMVGMPIIASDIPMNLEAVEDQNTALIFPVQDADSLAKKMTWAIENPEAMQILGVNARKVAVERFDIEKIARQYEDTLVKLAKKQS